MIIRRNQMQYVQFKNKFQNQPIILSKEVVKLEKNKQIVLNQLRRWQKKGLIIKLKKGMYLLNRNDRKINPSPYFIANQLYGPSYVSLEYALNFYGLIPEAVFDITSIVTKKTMRFRNESGVFIYQHIKADAFRGFSAIKEENGVSMFIAEPEKAIVDFLYLNLKEFKKETKDKFEVSYRFQNLESLNTSRIMELARLFNSHKLLQTAKDFCDFIREGQK